MPSLFYSGGSRVNFCPSCTKLYGKNTSLRRVFETKLKKNKELSSYIFEFKVSMEAGKRNIIFI